MSAKPRKKYDTEAVYHELVKKYGFHIYRKDLIEYEAATGIWPSFVQASKYRIGKGEYDISTYVPKSLRGTDVGEATKRVEKGMTETPEQVTKTVDPENPNHTGLFLSADEVKDKTTVQKMIEQIMRGSSELTIVPEKDSAFVSFGAFERYRKVIKSGIFCPVYTQGHTGCGKTFPVEQACALEKREYIRVQITEETDEDDLIGGLRLKANGNGETETVFEFGPLPIAMLRGAIVCLDEIDLASRKIMCLQPILEGKPITIKKLGITIKPQPGFNIFATANTKGRGSDDGKYIGAQMQNEAFLDRFAFTVEAEYPPVDIEQKILCKTYEKFGGEVTDEDAAQFRVLAKWADNIRQTYKEEGCDDLIALRRLVHIVTVYKIFENMDEAVRACLGRFDTGVQEKFLDFYTKLRPEPVIHQAAPKAKPAAPKTAKPKATGAPW